MRTVFFVMGEPIAQPRPRVYTRGGGHRVVSDSKRSSEWKRKVAQAAALLRMNGTSEIEGPVALRLLFLMPRPKSWPKTKRLAREPMPQRPDVDNLAKCVKDALTELLWRDDSQVVQLHAVKMRAAKDEEPGVKIEVRPYETEEQRVCFDADVVLGDGEVFL